MPRLSSRSSYATDNRESIIAEFNGGFLLVGQVDCVTCGIFDESKVSRSKSSSCTTAVPLYTVSSSIAVREYSRRKIG